MASLTSGMYTITNVAANAYVGRHSLETGSLLPKRVLSFPPGADAPRVSKMLGLVDGAATVAIGDNPGAAVLPDHPAERWKITCNERSGKDTYAIESNNRQAGWLMPADKPQTPVAVGPLMVGPSLPPSYLPSELWKIVRVDDSRGF